MTDAHDEGSSALTLGEAVALLGVTTISVLAVVSLALAQLGRHDGALALGITLAVLGLAAVLVRTRPRPTIRVDRLELVVVGVTVLLAAFFFLPGSTYAYADKDPGIYASHAFAIARDGDVDVPDPVLEAGLSPPGYSGSRFPGLWLPPDETGVVTSQFYHLQSALLATGHDLTGRIGVFQTTPLLAVGSVVLLLLAARRVAGTIPAAIAAAVLTTCMLQVWQAKSPGSEVLAQLFLIGSGLGAVLAIHLRWWLPAAISGGLLSLGFLARPDGFLYLALGTAIVGGVIASGRLDGRVLAFIGGIVAPLPYAMWNAYSERSDYTASNSVPDGPVLGGAMLACLLAGLVIRAVVARSGPVRLAVSVQRWSGAVGTALAGAVLVFLWLRADVLGADYAVNPRTGERFATLDEHALRWLSWFVSAPGLVAMAVGIGVLLLRPWDAGRFALFVPGGLLLPLYLWDPRIANRMMWWGRRFVPAALPAVALLIGLGLGWALLQRRSRALQAVAAVTAGYVLVFGASQSLDLRGHHEMGGSWTLGAEVASNGTADGSLFLFTRPVTPDVIQPNRNLPGALAFIHDRATSVLADPPSMTEIETYLQAMPDREVLVVVPGRELPTELPAERFERRDTIDQPISFWEESSGKRPNHPRALGYRLTVWALRPA